MRFSVQDIWRALLQPQPVPRSASNGMGRRMNQREHHLLPRASEDEEILRLASHGFRTPGVAHDLGNMLQVIASAVRLIDRSLDEGSRAKVKPFTESALGAVDRASVLARRLLDTARAGRRVEEPICPNETILGMRDLMILTTGPKIELRTFCNQDVPLIRCDGHELENVILNLVINARDAMPLGGKLILATHAERDARAAPRAAPSTAVISVCDTGSGMSEDVASKAFTPFYSTKAPGDGTGLGLAMVDAFARRCGGFAEIRSVVGCGTTIVLRLPACDR